MAPGSSVSKGNCKFETLLVKIFSLKSKTKKWNTSSYFRKSYSLLSKKTVYCSFRCGITMGECKTKAIQTNLGSFRYNKTYPGIIQAYSGMFRTLCYPDKFKTAVYSEPRHIHNPGIFRTPLYSECWHIRNLRHIQTPAMHLRRIIS